MKDRLGMGLPLTSPAIPAFVHPRRACSCTSCSFGFCRAPHSHSETRYSVSLPQPSHFFLHFSLLSRLFPFLSLSLSRESSFCSFFLPCFFPFLPFAILSYPHYFTPLPTWPFASVAFLSARPWIPRPSSVSLVCVCFLVYRFPFFVKASDTLIRRVVLFAFLHRSRCFARSRCNYRSIRCPLAATMSHNATF